MNPDHFQQAWQSQSAQSRLTINAELLLKEVQRNQRYFTAIIFWRDVREVGVALLLVPIIIYHGITLSLPWTIFLSVPAVIGVAAFLLVDRMRHGRHSPEPGEPLRQRVEGSLAQVNHQIWLLRNVFWWYLLPLAIPMLAFFGQIAWEIRLGGWLGVLATAGLGAQVVVVMVAVYWLNQTAVRSELEPRRQELEALLLSLQDETPAPG
jgi:hypothetical protein